MDKKTLDFSKYRLDKAKETLHTAEDIFKSGRDYASANNRAVLALERIDFKRHKDVIAYFNQNYVNTEIFPRTLGHKISLAQSIREDSDYDDEYQPSYEKTEQQINTAKELIQLVEKYINEK